MQRLQVAPTVRIQAEGYEAIISPSAGARLLKLTRSANNQRMDCVVPFDAQIASIDAHQWPKAGAFVMLPFTNRLDPAAFEWQGRKITLHNGSNTGQGLHGFGHRRDWAVSETSDSHIALELSHAAVCAEWPWTFKARLNYKLGASGLSVALSVCNTDATPMPVSLGWHPFIPFSNSETVENNLLRFTASHMHDIGLDGLGRARLSEDIAANKTFVLDGKTASTTAFENFGGEVEVILEKNLRLKLVSQHAPHLLVHRPPKLPFVCIEPVGSLPGAFKNYTKAQSDRELRLDPGEWRHLVCNLGFAAIV